MLARRMGKASDQGTDLILGSLKKKLVLRTPLLHQEVLTPAERKLLLPHLKPAGHLLQLV